jgi:hypothetical protein
VKSLRKKAKDVRIVLIVLRRSNLQGRPRKRKKRSDNSQMALREKPIVDVTSCATRRV